MPEVQVLANNELNEALRWQVLSFMRLNWPWIFTGDDRFGTEIQDPALYPVHFVVAEGDVLISYSTVIQRQIEHAGDTFRTYGLGNVMTYPAFRRQGFGGRVVAAATAYINASDADVAGLFCDEQTISFYHRHGWQRMTDAATLIGPRDAPEVDQGLRMMLFVSEKGQAARSAFAQEPWYIGEPW